MDSVNLESTTACHVVAMPYPGRGHINPMMNLCKLLSFKNPSFLISFVVTEEWLGFIGDQNKPENIHFRTIPNVIPSEIGRANDFSGFVEAVSAKMEAPFEKLLDRFESPANLIIADTFLSWSVGVGNRRNIPVASLFTMSASCYSSIHNLMPVQQNRDFPAGEVAGISSSEVTDLHKLSGSGEKLFAQLLKNFSWVKKAQFLLLASFYELESQTIDKLRSELSIPIYPIGPCIPYLELQQNFSIFSQNDRKYFQWLNSQPKSSVLYVSFGSFLSISNTQMEEFVAGLKKSKVRYLLVARGEPSPVEDGGCNNGLVVPWCEQLRVLCHPSIGGFWSHCGWNSTLEAVFAGIPVLTSPISWDQIPNSKLITDEWGIGWRVGNENLVTREEISELVGKFMDSEDSEVKMMRKRAKDLSKVCRQAISKGGSSSANLDDFIRNISSCYNY